MIVPIPSAFVTFDPSPMPCNGAATAEFRAFDLIILGGPAVALSIPIDLDMQFDPSTISAIITVGPYCASVFCDLANDENDPAPTVVENAETYCDTPGVKFAHASFFLYLNLYVTFPPDNAPTTTSAIRKNAPRSYVDKSTTISWFVSAAVSVAV